jgi:multicopper oxidase
VFINDWFLQLGDTLMADLLKGTFMKMDRKKPPDKKTALKDKPDVGDVPFQSGLINGKGRMPGTSTSLSVVKIHTGETVRLRLINGSSTYAFRFQIDSHPLTVIATDGAPIKPVTVDNLLINIGERYDVLIKADQYGMHWIRVVTLDGHEVRAMLCYAEAAQTALRSTPVRWGPRELTPEAMHAPAPAQLDARPREFSFVLGGSMMPYRWSINDQFYPKVDAIALQKDEPVRFILKNPTMMDHPFHLHGHYFRVLGKPGALNLTDPVLKDTVNVPSKSELVLQWKATNPGRWFFHCHIEWHLETGMARVIEIKPS